MPWILDSGAVERHDDVAGLHAALKRWRITPYRIDERTLGVRQLQLGSDPRRHRHEILGRDPDRSASHFLVLLEVVAHAPRQVARHRKADALIPATLAEDDRIDADQFAAAVHQRAT